MRRMILGMLLCSTAMGGIRYVNPAGEAPNDGASCATGHTTITNALSASTDGDVIRVCSDMSATTFISLGDTSVATKEFTLESNVPGTRRTLTASTGTAISSSGISAKAVTLTDLAIVVSGNSGGGILITANSDRPFSLNNVAITYNGTSGYCVNAAALAAATRSFTFTNCEWSHNAASAGVTIVDAAAVTVTGCAGTNLLVSGGNTVPVVTLTDNVLLSAGLAVRSTVTGAGVLWDMRDNIISGSGCLSIPSYYAGVRLEGNRFTNIASAGSAVMALGTEPSEGVANANPLGGFIVRDNVILSPDRAEHGAFIGSGATPEGADGNLGGQGIFEDNIVFGGDWPCVFKARRVIATHNRIASLVDDDAEPTIVLAGAQNCVLMYNTVVSRVGPVISVYADLFPSPSKNNVVTHNIFASIGGGAVYGTGVAGDASGNVFDNNLYYWSEAGDLISIAGTTCADLSEAWTEWASVAGLFARNDRKSAIGNPLFSSLDPTHPDFLKIPEGSLAATWPRMQKIQDGKTPNRLERAIGAHDPTGQTGFRMRRVE